MPRVVAAADYAAVAELARAISGAQSVCIRLVDAAGARVLFFPERDGVTDLPQALHSGDRFGYWICRIHSGTLILSNPAAGSASTRLTSCARRALRTAPAWPASTPRWTRTT